MKIKQIISLALIGIVLSGCQKFLDNAPLPTEKVPAEGIYDTDLMAGTAVTGIFLSTSLTGTNGTQVFATTFGSSLSGAVGLYSDELKTTFDGSVVEPFYKNKISPTNSVFWKDIYQKIYMINTAIEGVNNSKGNLVHKNQWLGECYFLRAFYYYQAFNIYGAVPVALTSDWQTNNTLSRLPEIEVYQQIISDLNLAKSMLTDNYKNGNGTETNTRYRPNKAAASAMLARIYLYTKEWDKARAEATSVITNTKYSLVPVNEVFLINSRETIWSLANNVPKPSTPYSIFIKNIPNTLSATQTARSVNMFGVLSDQLLNAFESGDARFSSWIYNVSKAATSTAPAVVYRLPGKYPSSANTNESQVLLRLAEVYLIRAEAKFMLNDASAADDLNAVRRRANLGAINPSDFMAAVTKERQTELFTENGQRFFDLKRLGTINSVMATVATTKLSTWEPFMAYWPIPSNEIIQNPNIIPNPGYQQ